MDKSMYKQLVSDLLRKESELKNKLEAIWEAVRNNPNNMNLGEVVRNMYWSERDTSNDRQMDLFSG